MRSLMATIVVVAVVAAACAADDSSSVGASSSTTTSTASLTTATSTTSTTASVPISTTTTATTTAAVRVPDAPQAPAADSESRGAWPQAPDVWYPAASPYLTVDSDIEFRVYARRDATVQVGSITAEPVQDWAGGNAMFVATIGLDEGPNTIPVDVDGAVTDITVVRGPSWQRGYGRVLDTWGHYLELGIDFGEMNLEPDYGQGDFSPGEIAVVFKPLARDVALIDSPFWEWETITRGDDAVWEYFAYGEGSHMDVYDILLDGDTVLQLEGPVPLGD
jgi:hypothetical protein